MMDCVVPKQLNINDGIIGDIISSNYSQSSDSDEQWIFNRNNDTPKHTKLIVDYR